MNFDHHVYAIHLGPTGYLAEGRIASIRNKKRRNLRYKQARRARLLPVMVRVHADSWAFDEAFNQLKRKIDRWIDAGLMRRVASPSIFAGSTHATG